MDQKLKKEEEIKKWVKIIKAIQVKEERDIDKYKELNNADIILFDSSGMEESLSGISKIWLKRSIR